MKLSGVPRRGTVARVVRNAVADAVGVVVPVACAGCGAADRSVCERCRTRLVGRSELVERPGLSAWAALRYEAEAASVIGAYKDGGRTDATTTLAAALLVAIAAALGDLPSGSTEVCTVPSTAAAMRARGYAPVERLLAQCGIRSSKVLRLARDHEDQAGLTAEARRANTDGALVARGLLTGRRFLLVDDVLTTGSTLAEARRAVTAAGGAVAAIAVLAETPLRRSVPDSKLTGNSP